MANSNQAEVNVSVAMITYNHEDYIAQAIEGVLMQQTSFTFELVIGEDCSTDGTREIVDVYSRKFPDKIRPMLREKNIGATPNFVSILDECHGKYVALCEGDDYWTDPLKLQKQVDFMEAQPDYSVCFHRIYQLNQATGDIEIWKQSRKLIKHTYRLKNIIRDNFIGTPSIMLRNGLVKEFTASFCDTVFGDWMLLVMYAQHGYIGFIDKAMAVHRIHSGGIYSGADISAQRRMVVQHYEALRMYLNPEYKSLIKAGISDHLLYWAGVSADQGDIPSARNYLLRSITECPINADMLILDKMVLLFRLFLPSVYKIAKRIQARL